MRDHPASRSNAFDVFAEYGLTQIINASGTETVMGASPVCEDVLQAVNALVPHSVSMLQLQSVACRTIAGAFACEAGLVVGCTSAGIAVAVAACMTGQDLALVEQLPDPTGMKHEVILQRGHHVTYNGQITQNIAITGAKVIEIGAATECGAYQLKAAITPRTAAAMYVVSHHTVQSGLIDLKTFCDVCHAQSVPVIVDGAAEPEPRMFLRAGADLVITSMHKQFASLTGATIAGSLDLVRACLYQERGIGRPMKVGKEGVIAAIAAVRRWAEADRAQLSATLNARLERGRTRLAGLPGITATVELDASSGLFSRLHLQIDPAKAGMSAFELAAALANLRPSIAVRSLMADIGLLQIDLRRASDATADHIASQIEQIVSEAVASGRRAGKASGGPTPNLADLVLTDLAAFPLTLSR
jgi:D-glucosaminate-6-phosphate ammonia-lyase